jgi:Flp pilus assembly protein TadD
MTVRKVRLAAKLLAIGAGLLAGACATSGLAHRMEDAAREGIRARGLSLEEIIVPFEITPDMKAWIEKEVPKSSREEIQLNWLLQSVLNRSNPAFRYESGHTGTAGEVFREGRANCLGFTQMFIALARELDLPVYFLRVSDLQSFEREGDLIVASAHITAAMGPPNTRKVLDFAERPVSAYRWVEAISDLTAIALYYSNRGAEALRDGQNAEGLELLGHATRLDPELAEAWVNLGVAERRSGDSEAAEADYRKALEVDPSTITAYQNLASLLRVSGRAHEADELLSLTDRTGNRNPFSYLALGDLSLRQGRTEEAQRFYRRAIRLDPDQAESQAAMGHWALQTGRLREAAKYLRKAQKLDPANGRTELLERSLNTRPASSRG